MTSSTLTEPRPQSPPVAHGDPATARAHPIVLALAAAVLFWFSFPPAGWGWLGWFALTPLFLLVPSERPRWLLYLSAWLGGLTFWLLAIRWVRLTDESAWLGWVVMATALSFWWPAFLLFARLAARGLRLPLMVAAPVAWVGLEYLRALVLTGFPWYYLAHSQYVNPLNPAWANPIIQVADLTGTLGVSLLMAVANACWAELVVLSAARVPGSTPRSGRPRTVRVAVLAVAVAATLVYGAVRIATASFREGPRVALLQSDIIQRYKDTLSAHELMAVYERLVQKALDGRERPDLIVWPETSYPYKYVNLDPALDDAGFERLVKEIDPHEEVQPWRDKVRLVPEVLHGWADQTGAAMLIGSIVYDFHRKGLSRFNSALLFEPGKPEVQSYYKLHLVPFGEYVPLVDYLPWLTALTPYRGNRTHSLTFGSAPRWFEFRGLRFAAAICFEDTVPHVVRRFFAEAKGGRQPDFLVNLSNDGWFHGSEEHDMHLACSVFRTVENRAPLARAVNLGITAVIDGNGRIRAALPKHTEGVLTTTIPLDDRTSWYSRGGDWLGQACLFGSLATIPAAAVVGLRKRSARRAA